MKAVLKRGQVSPRLGPAGGGRAGTRHSLPRKACRLPLHMSSVTMYTGSPAEHTACSRMRRSCCRLLSVRISWARSASFMLAAGEGSAQDPHPHPQGPRAQDRHSLTHLL